MTQYSLIFTPIHLFREQIRMRYRSISFRFR